MKLILKLSGLIIVTIFLSCFHEPNQDESGVKSEYETSVYEVESTNGYVIKIKHYKPSNDPAFGKAIIFYHGGGWKRGTLKASEKYCSSIAAKGYHCFTPSYRTFESHNTGVEEAIVDAEVSTQWLIENADYVGSGTIDFYTAGSSAGGLLAAWQNNVQGHILWVPVLKTSGEGSFKNDLINEENEKIVDIISNLSVNLSPKRTIIFHGSKDRTVPIAGSKEYCQILNELEYACDLKMFDGIDHSGFEFDSLLREETIEDVIKFLTNQ